MDETTAQHLLEGALGELESSYVYPQWVADAAVELDEVIEYVREVFPALRSCPDRTLRQALAEQQARIRLLI